jgi:hypothetical protein
MKAVQVVNEKDYQSRFLLTVIISIIVKPMDNWRYIIIRHWYLKMEFQYLKISM